MNKAETFYVSMVILLLLAGMITIIYFGSKSRKEFDSEKKIQYQECKEKTSNVEWCLKAIYNQDYE